MEKINIRLGQTNLSIQYDNGLASNGGPSNNAISLFMPQRVGQKNAESLIQAVEQFLEHSGIKAKHHLIRHSSTSINEYRLDGGELSNAKNMADIIKDLLVDKRLTLTKSNAEFAQVASALVHYTNNLKSTMQPSIEPLSQPMRQIRAKIETCLQNINGKYLIKFDNNKLTNAIMEDIARHYPTAQTEVGEREKFGNRLKEIIASKPSLHAREGEGAPQEADIKRTSACVTLLAGEIVDAVAASLFPLSLAKGR